MVAFNGNANVIRSLRLKKKQQQQLRRRGNLRCVSLRPSINVQEQCESEAENQQSYAITCLKFPFFGLPYKLCNMLFRMIANSVYLLLFLANDSQSIVPDIIDWKNSDPGGNGEVPFSDQWTEKVGFQVLQTSEEHIDRENTSVQEMAACSEEDDPECNTTSYVNKCCAEGFRFSLPLLKCIPSDREFNLQQIMSHSGYSLIDNSSYRIRHSAVNCSGNVTYLWSSKTRYRSSMSITDSKLYVPRVWFRDAHYFQDYCVDDFFSSDGSNQVTYFF